MQSCLGSFCNGVILLFFGTILSIFLRSIPRSRPKIPKQFFVDFLSVFLVFFGTILTIFLRSIPRSRPKIPKHCPKMGPDGTKMGPKLSEKAPGGAPKTKKTTKEARWDKRHSNLNVPEPLGPYFGGPRAAKRGPRPSQERPIGWMAPPKP